jgi:hypothetical protein
MSVDDSTPQGIDRSRSVWAQSIAYGPGPRGGISVKISLYFHVKIGFPIIIVQDFRKGPVTRTRNRASLLWNSASFLRNRASFLVRTVQYSALENIEKGLYRCLICIQRSIYTL